MAPGFEQAAVELYAVLWLVVFGRRLQNMVAHWFYSHRSSGSGPEIQNSRLWDQTQWLAARITHSLWEELEGNEKTHRSRTWLDYYIIRWSAFRIQISTSSPILCYLNIEQMLLSKSNTSDSRCMRLPLKMCFRNTKTYFNRTTPT